MKSVSIGRKTGNTLGRRSRVTAQRLNDINKFIGIGEVFGDPKVKYVPQTESYLVEFQLRSRVEDPLDPEGDGLVVDYPVVVRREKQALFLKDVLKSGLRLYLEGNLIPRPLNPQAARAGKSAVIPYHIELKEVELIDPPERPAYPEDIKRIDR